MDPTQLVGAVEAAFEVTARGLIRWDDPHPPPERAVREEEYSRVTDAGKWRIVGARVEAWLQALDGRVSVERDAAVEWEEPPGPVVTRVDVVRPAVPGGLPLVVGRSRIGDVDDAGVVVAVGLPAVVVHRVPDCGCDACDSGSADVIAEIDSWLGAIVDGSFRHLSSRLGTITVRGDGVRGWSERIELPQPTATSGWRFVPLPPGAGSTAPEVPPRRPRLPRPRRRFDVDAVLADPTGWREWSGPPWIA